MLTKLDILAKREQILALAQKHGGSNVRLFGSVARGDQDHSSDVDFIVQFEPNRTLFDQGGLVMELRKLLGVDVDVISAGALDARFGQEVNRYSVLL